MVVLTTRRPADVPKSLSQTAHQLCLEDTTRCYQLLLEIGPEIAEKQLNSRFEESSCSQNGGYTCRTLDGLEKLVRDVFVRRYQENSGRRVCNKLNRRREDRTW